MSDAPLSPRDPRSIEAPARAPTAHAGRVRNLERVVDAALSAATALRRTPDLELSELRRAGAAVSDLCEALADTCGHLAHELSNQDPEPSDRAHAAIEHLYRARDALTDAGDATRRTTSAAAALHPRAGNAPRAETDNT
jgi:hypothetical protein